MPAAGRRILVFVRWLHVYLSMFGAGLLLLIAVTGLMLNHKGPLGLENTAVQIAEGAVPRELLDPLEEAGLVAFLRSRCGLSGTAGPAEVDDAEVRVVFRRPGRTGDAVVRRSDGNLRVTTESYGLGGAVTDLHKGAPCGTAWWVLLDVAAVALVLVALTGLYLALATPARRRWGLVALALGAAVCLGAYFLLIP